MTKTGCVCLMSVLLLAPFAPRASGQDQQSQRKVSAEEDAARLKELLDRIGERVRKFQEDLFSVKWTAVHRGQQLKTDLTPKGKPQETVSEWIFLRRPAPDNPQETFAVAVIEVKSVDGKPPKEKKSDSATYRHPLEFLSPEKQSQWVFSWEGETDLQGSKTVMITAAPVIVTKPASKVKGRFFYVQGLQQKARIWIDPQTYDVVQVEWRLLDTFEFNTGFGLNWYGPFFVARPGREIEYEKMDKTIRFARVAFKDPDQTLLLPMSEEYMHLIRGAGKNPVYRSTVSYTDYKRFVTDVKLTSSPPKC
jgi:hypothetical protein